MNVGQAITRFFANLWSGLGSVSLPYFNISLRSILLGMFVVDFSIGILFTLIRFYGSISHTSTHIGSRAAKATIRHSRARKSHKG